MGYVVENLGRISSLLEFTSVLIAAVAAWLAYKAAREAHLSAERSSEAALELSKAQNVLYTTELRLQYFSDLRSWADESIDVLAQAMALCHLDPQRCSFNYRERQVEIANKLSALADRGKLFLPNEDRSKYGTHKEYSSQGNRHRALTQLVGAFNDCLDISYLDRNNQHRISESIESRRRKFLSIVQQVIDTDEWKKLMHARLVEQPDAHTD